MFQRKIYIDANSSLEISTRVYNNEERLMLTISGPKNDKEITSSSVILTDQHASLFNEYLKDALDREINWPIEDKV